MREEKSTIKRYKNMFVFRYIAGAGIGCPTQCTELMDCLFTFFKERLIRKLESSPTRDEIKAFLAQKGDSFGGVQSIPSEII